MLDQRVRYIPEESPADMVLYWATHGDAQTAADMILRQRRYVDHIAADDLNADDLADLRAEMLRVGLGFVQEEADLFVVDIAEIAHCIWCHQPHHVEDPHAGCSGPVPLDEVEDDTAAACVLCMHGVAGPPAPYCCAGREKLIEALHGDEAMRIKRCDFCKGIGVLSHACDRCSGTGVAGVR